MINRRGRIAVSRSATRSDSLKGRESGRKNQRQLPVQSRTVGLPMRPKPDPALRPWPHDCVQIVAATPSTVNVRGIKGTITDQRCADCDCRLAVDSFTIQTALEMPERNRRPLKYICVSCCVQLYDRSTITLLVDHRQKGGTNEGTQLDE